MPDYKSMYFELFGSVSDAIEILCKAQRKAEETFINSADEDEEEFKSANFIKPEEQTI